ncbi:hypothetical protein BCR44DRAFT_35317 [Catenaria anguillulae PL171]|uniref:UBA domain-containing protein n=1 Tax=Catenaria anguillulae PL171 TaxID=765915 RepID=A0A1Y2HZ06_9FUNG|nr:hypothetical protein BCR44DRAFT_35317 [Catenaria anguillulae PL171]
MLSHGSAAGFYNAPTTQVALYSVGGSTLLASVFKAKQYFPISVTPMLAQKLPQLHRLVTSHLVFGSSSELVFGGLLLYHLRVLERLYGARKYSAFVFVTTTIATLLEVTILVLFRSIGWNVETLASGPYAMLFASLYLFHHRVPENDRFRFLGISFSQKSFVYLMTIQLLTLSWPTSLIPALSGFTAGSIYLANPLNIQSWRFPPAIENLASKLFSPVTANSRIPPRETNPEPPRPTSAGAARRGSLAAAQAALDQAAAGGSGSGAAPEQPVSEDSVQMLVSMGFDRDRAVAVLRRVGGDMNRAVQALL